MTIEQVIKAGQFSETQIQALMDHGLITSGMCWAIAIGVLIFLIGCLIGRVTDWDSDAGGGFVFVGILIATLGSWGIHSLLLSGQHDKAEQALTDQWKKQYAMPYLKSLPEEKHDIIYMKIATATAPSDVDAWFTGDISTEKLTSLTIAYKLGRAVQTDTDWYNTSMTLAKSKDPYVEYRFLKKDLGHGIRAGQYDKTIYLPENYKFTDIK